MTMLRSRASATTVVAKKRRLSTPLIGTCAVVFCTAIFPLLGVSNYHVFVAASAGVYLLVAQGLNLLLGYAGQPSLGHGGLVAMGAYGSALVMVSQGWSFWVALLFGAVVAGAAAALMALPAMRLSAWYLALITLGFAIVVEGLIVELEPMTGGWSGLSGIPAPELFGVVLGDRGMYWTILGINVLVALAIRNAIKSRLGRALAALRDGPETATANGVHVRLAKVAVFVASGVLAGLAGALFAVQKVVITPDDFHVEFSIFFLVVVVLGGAGRLWGPVLGTLVFFAVPDLLVGLAEWRQLVYGVVLLLLVVFAPEGLIGLLDRLAHRWRSWYPVAPDGVATHPHDGDETGESGDADMSHPVECGPGQEVRTTTDDRPAVDPKPELAVGRLRHDEPNGVVLSVRDLVRSFGGVRALDGVELDVGRGQVHAVVGSNGSGKTTFLNLVSGFYRSDGGTICLGGQRIDGRPPWYIARAGVARSFQTPRLLGDLTVIDNVLLGAYARETTSAAELVVRAPRAGRERRELTEEAAGLLDFVGLGDAVEAKAGTVPHGYLRLIEIARALMSRPQLLLLDEPAAGLSLDELERLGDLIDQIRGQDLAVIVVEHHIELVADVSDMVSVFDRGRILAHGTASEVFDRADVAEAYMGGRSS